jgi:glutaredoxin
VRKLSQFGKRILGGSARKLTSVVGMVTDDLRGGLRELLAPPTTEAPGSAPRGSVPVAGATSAPPKLGDPEKPAQIFGRPSCPWTSRAIALMEREGASVEFVDLDAPENGTLSSWLVVETKQNTNPYVFLRGRFVGGFNALDEITRLGQLPFEMMTPAERARQPSRIRIEVAPRDDNDRPPPGEHDG